MEIEVGNQKPDGVILDTGERMIYIIEGARCSDTEEAMQTVEVRVVVDDDNWILFAKRQMSNWWTRRKNLWLTTLRVFVIA